MSLDVQMKTRKIITLGIIAFVAVVALTFLYSPKITSIPSDQFYDTLRKQKEIQMSSQMTGAPQPLPLALRILFPKNSSGGSIGFPDRSDILVLNDDINCIAHVRKNNVCYVTLSGPSGVKEMRKKIHELFPGISVD